MTKRRRVIAAVAVVAVTSLSVAATTASAGARDPLERRVTKLERKVSNLQSQVASLQGQSDALEDRVAALEQSTDAGLSACLNGIYVSQYDDYLADDGVTSITGLDLDTAASADFKVVTWVCADLP
jgi:hypothetical protein